MGEWLHLEGSVGGRGRDSLVDFLGWHVAKLTSRVTLMPVEVWVAEFENGIQTPMARGRSTVSSK